MRQEVSLHLENYVRVLSCQAETGLRLSIRTSLRCLPGLAWIGESSRYCSCGAGAAPLSAVQLLLLF